MAASSPSDPGDSPARVESQPRRGLRRREAALYVGVSPTTFDYWVGAGWMPPGKRIGKGVVLWDIRALDTAFDSLMEDGHINPWDQAEVPPQGEGRTSVCPPGFTFNKAFGTCYHPGPIGGVSLCPEGTYWSAEGCWTP